MIDDREQIIDEQDEEISLQAVKISRLREEIKKLRAIAVLASGYIADDGPCTFAGEAETYCDDGDCNYCALARAVDSNKHLLRG